MRRLRIKYWQWRLDHAKDNREVLKCFVKLIKLNAR